MASCITDHWDGRSAPQIKLTVTSSESDATATLSWTLEYIANYPASTSSNRTYKATINGEQVTSGSYDINGKTGTIKLDSGEKVITKGTSSKKISFSCSMDFNLTWSGNYGGTKSASGNISVGKKTSYTISYNANGGSGAPSAQTKWYGTTLVLSSTKPTRIGYTFKGWGTTSTATTSTYSPGSNYTSNSGRTLYAVWSALTYRITYSANGGSGAPSAQTKSYNKDLTLSSTKPTRTNYTFKGWSSSKSSSTVSYSAGGTYSKNASIDLYAVWSLSYTKPRISKFTVNRCTSDGTISEEGNCALVKFSYACDKNVSSVKIYYKLSTNSSYSSVTVPTPSEKTGTISYIVKMNFSTEFSYDIKVYIADASGSNGAIKPLLPMIYVVDFLKGGKGMAIGKPSTESELLDIAFKASFDKDLISKSNVYAQGDKKCFTNGDTIPISCGGTGKTSAEAASKALGYGKVIWSGGSWMTSAHTASLSEAVSDQPHGIVLSFSEYKDGAAQDYGWTHFFVSKRFVTLKTEQGSSFIMSTGGFEAIGVKYLYIFDTKITGNDVNSKTGTTSGISYQNNRFMLRYVMGV